MSDYTSISVCDQCVCVCVCVSPCPPAVFSCLCVCLEVGLMELDADGGSVDSGRSWFGSGFG